MDIKLFSLCNEESAVADAGKKYIFDCVGNFTDDCAGFAHFTSQKRMLLAFSQSLLSAEVIIIAVQGTMYNTTKHLLCAALDIKPEENPLVAEKLTPMLNSGKIKPNSYNANVTFPSQAEIFPTNDYINCGFAISSGSQHIIYMPIDTPKSDEVVLGSLYDYLAEISDGEATQCAFNYRRAVIIQRTALKLAGDNISVAVAPDNAEQFLSPNLTDKTEQSIKIEKSYNDISYSNQKDFAVNAARTVRTNSGTQFGAAVSDVECDENGQNFAFIAVADEHGTTAEKIFAEKDETKEQLLSICVDRLMLLLYNYDEIETEETETVLEKKQDSKFKGAIGIALAGAILAASVTAFILALLN